MRGCYTPRMLTCLHSFCDNCVRSGIVKILPPEKQVQSTEEANKDETAGQQNGTDEGKSCQNDNKTLFQPKPLKKPQTSHQKVIVCPLCKESTKLPENGGIHGLPVNVFLQSLLLIKGYKLEEGKLCEYCSYDGKESVGGSLCLECQDVLCSDCAGAHHRTKVTRGHQVVPFVEIAKHRYDHDVRGAQRVKCSEHKNLETELFCEECKVTMCMECKGKQHYQHSYWSLESAVRHYHPKTKNFLGTINSKLPSIAAWIKFIQSYDDSVKMMRKDRVVELENHCRDLHKVIEEYKSKQLERINKVCDTEERNTAVKMEKLMRAAQYLHHDAQLLKNLLAFGKVDELLSLQAPIAQRAAQLCRQQLPGVSSKLSIQFQPSPLTNETLDELFGKLSVSFLPLTQKESVELGGNSMSAGLMLPSVSPSCELVASFDADCGTDSKDVWPSGVCMTLDGDHVIIDRDNRRVKIFDKSGGVKANFAGTKHNELGCPFDVAILKNGNLAVTDYESEDVKIFKPSGEFVKNIRGCFKYPRGIAVTSEGNIVVVDCHFRRVTIHDPNTRKLLKTIEGKDEDGCDFFTDPYYVAVTPDDKIIVTDWAAPNIRVFGTDGKQLNSYGSYGTRQDQILHPYGVCSDAYGYIFVADNQNHRVHLLLPDGNFSRHMVTKENSLWHPIAMTTDNFGNLIVTEALGKVRIYKYM
ncbi:E3 ubiquitin-protein ligase TRIM71-like [Liolophura sinensis]|uniref:E3 ubiquitin-protein ligase TRIM71-like n=1 Tax=Liolophura sinensis TaxID=3198878 RepID=UPI0031585448